MTCLLALLLGACAGQASSRYGGPVTVTEGNCGLASSGTAHATLQISGADVLFAPDDGAVVLRGQIDAVGHVTAAAAGTGAEHKPFPMTFVADRRDGVLTGQYATPQCRATVRLDQTH